MKEIKRYTIQTLRIRGQEPYITMGISSDGDFVLHTDHKAVVEVAKDHSYDEGFNAKVDNYELKIETMQKRIDELEADKLEMAKAVLDKEGDVDSNGIECCHFCDEYNDKHFKDCIVLKAQKYIEEVERN